MKLLDSIIEFFDRLFENEVKPGLTGLPEPQNIRNRTTFYLRLNEIKGFVIKSTANKKSLVISGFSMNPFCLSNLTKGDYLIIITTMGHHSRYVVKDFNKISINNFFFVECDFNGRTQQEFDKDHNFFKANQWI